jgi:hypothetical protein
VKPEAAKDAALAKLLAEIAQLIDERFGAHGDGARYLLVRVRELLHTLGDQEELELTCDQLEDVVEALGVDAWS